MFLTASYSLHAQQQYQNNTTTQIGCRCRHCFFVVCCTFSFRVTAYPTNLLLTAAVYRTKPAFQYIFCCVGLSSFGTHSTTPICRLLTISLMRHTTMGIMKLLTDFGTAKNIIWRTKGSNM